MFKINVKINQQKTSQCRRCYRDSVWFAAALTATESCWWTESSSTFWPIRTEETAPFLFPLWKRVAVRIKRTAPFRTYKQISVSRSNLAHTRVSSWRMRFTTHAARFGSFRIYFGTKRSALKNLRTSLSFRLLFAHGSGSRSDVCEGTETDLFV